MDEDDDGSITFKESQFFKSALSHDSIMKNFETDSDGKITFTELWNAWIVSRVHNWTEEQTLTWLTNEVELKELIPIFKQHRIKGANFPKLALSDFSYLKSIGIRSFLHRRRLMLKALDATLYGPPRKRHSIFKDYIVVLACLLATGGLSYGWLISQRIKSYQAEVAKLSEKAEQIGSDAFDDSIEGTDYEYKIKKLENENVQLEKMVADLRNENHRTESEYAVQINDEFVKILQDCKCAEEKLLKRENQSARELYGKVRAELDRVKRKRTTFVGAINLLHGEGLEKLDKQISETRDYMQRVNRSQEISVIRWKSVFKYVKRMEKNVKNPVFSGELNSKNFYFHSAADILNQAYEVL